MNAGALHFAFHKMSPNGTIAERPRAPLLDAQISQQAFDTDPARVFVEAAEACVDFNKERRSVRNPESTEAAFESAANEQGRGGDERERKRDLRDPQADCAEGISNQPARIFAGLLFKFQFTEAARV